MTQLQKLPVGIQDFEKLRTDGYAYVDKTALVYQLASLSTPFFLSRPRRFGKSLLLSTLKAYFLGKKELFKGLSLSRLETTWDVYPVFHIDMNADAYADMNGLMSALDTNLSVLETAWGRVERERTPASRLLGLIQRASAQTGKKVVVLIDEYDKPLLDTMHNASLNEEIRTQLRGFYGVLKTADPYLRFLLLTGVTKFSQVNVFSGLNQLRDISMDAQFASLCGITETELIDNFQDELGALADKIDMSYEETVVEMRRNYDGYHFCEDTEGLYNPFSVLNTLAAQKFKYYWFRTGTPTFLIELIRSNPRFNVMEMDGTLQVSAENIDTYRVDSDNLIPFLYQSGYLTIKGYDKQLDTYSLGFPNEEVKYGFLSELLPMLLQLPEENNFAATSFVRDLKNGDVDAFMTRIQSLFAGIPYPVNNKRNEDFYQTICYILFTLMGQFAEMEYLSARGRADLVLKTSDSIYVFEFKMMNNGTAEDALKQIDDSGYLIPYRADKRRLVKVGAEFSEKERTLSRWLIKS
jgi:hypothetical protein